VHACNFILFFLGKRIIYACIDIHISGGLETYPGMMIGKIRP